MATRKNEPKPSLIIIMTARTSCLYKQAPECKNLILCQRIVTFHHCTMTKNANKSHHLLYLLQQEKTNLPQPPIVLMTTPKNE